MRAAEHAPRSWFHMLENIHSLAEIAKCGAGVFAERLRIKVPHQERENIVLSKNAY